MISFTLEGSTDRPTDSHREADIVVIGCCCKIIVGGGYRTNSSDGSMLDANVSVGDGSIGDGSIFVGDNIARVDRVGDYSDSFGRFGHQPSESDSRIIGDGRHIVAVVITISSGVRVPPIRLA